MAEATSTEYTGTLMLPGEKDERQVSVSLNAADQAVQIRFDLPVEGESDWSGSNVRIVQRLKYSEAVFSTTGIPMDPVEMTWKFNASHTDNSLAGVIIPKPNALRVTGEQGFILNKVS